METRTLIDRFFAAWNATDAATRRTEIAAVWNPDGRFVDPLSDVSGHDGLDDLLAGFQAQFPGMVFTQSGQIDAHHRVLRFSWELAPTGGKVVAAGTDVAILDDDGRMMSIASFFDMEPAIAVN